MGQLYRFCLFSVYQCTQRVRIHEIGGAAKQIGKVAQRRRRRRRRKSVSCRALAVFKANAVNEEDFTGGGGGEGGGGIVMLALLHA